MNNTPDSLTTRREFIKTTGRIAAASALAGVALPAVHAASSDVIQVGLVGAGGRGTGTAGAGAKLVAIADVFEDKLSRSYNEISRQFKDKVDVPKDRQFIGFDGYKKVMDALKPGDVVILTTPL